MQTILAKSIDHLDKSRQATVDNDIKVVSASPCHRLAKPKRLVPIIPKKKKKKIVSVSYMINAKKNCGLKKVQLLYVAICYF